jgi:hypothetical protein
MSALPGYFRPQFWFRYREGITFTPTGEKFEAIGLKM